MLISCSAKKVVFNDKELNYPIPTDISTLDPALCYDEACQLVLGQIYEPLIEYEYFERPYKLKPLLIEEMPLISNNGTVYTFKLKKNIYYHNQKLLPENSREVKARDFINQIKRIAFIKTQSKGWWIFDNKVKGINKFRDQVKTLDDMFKNEIEGVSAPDDYTLKITILKPDPQFIYSFTMGFIVPLPEEIIRKADNNLRETTLGTGAYKLKSWVESSEIKLVTHEDFHEDFFPGTLEKLPFIPSINFKIIKESNTRWLNFIKGKLDLFEIDKDEHAMALNDQGELKEDIKKLGITNNLTPTLTYWWVSFNMTHPILGRNKKLRKAIAYAIDQERYIALFTNNTGERANSIYPPAIAGHHKNPWPIQHDLIKAKELLSEAGFPNGKGLPTFKFDLRNSSTKRRQIGEFFKSQLSKIGINLDIIPNTFPGYLKKAREGKLEIWQDGWIMDYPDPENSLQLLVSDNAAPGPNVTSFKNKHFDRLFLELKETGSPQRKMEILTELEDIVKEELPWHMLYYSRYNILTHDRLKNYQFTNVIRNFAKYLKITSK